VEEKSKTKPYKEVKRMNLKSLLVVFTLSLLLLTPMVTKCGETKISMTLWNRATVERESGEFTERYFSLGRGYLRIEPKFTDRIKGRFNVDFFSDDDALDGAGLKLKYAYLDFKELIPIPESKVTAGLIKSYFGTIYDWNYITIQKALEDKEKVTSSTDYGMALYGYLPEGYGEYAISVLNGEGYKKTGSDVNLNPAYQANVRLIPIPGVTIGGSVRYEDVSFDPDTSISNLVYAGVGHLAFGPFEVWGEYLVKDLEETKSQGFMVMPIVKLGKLSGVDVDLVGRYDNWDANADVDNDGHSRIIAGFNWNILRDAKGKPQVLLQVNGERTTYEDASKDPVDKLMMQLRWAFSTKIK
jgi:hypothetical protein